MAWSEFTTWFDKHDEGVSKAVVDEALLFLGIFSSVTVCSRKRLAARLCTAFHSSVVFSTAAKKCVAVQASFKLTRTCYSRSFSANVQNAEGLLDLLRSHLDDAVFQTKGSMMASREVVRQILSQFSVGSGRALASSCTCRTGSIDQAVGHDGREGFHVLGVMEQDNVSLTYHDRAQGDFIGVWTVEKLHSVRRVGDLARDCDTATCLCGILRGNIAMSLD